MHYKYLFAIYGLSGAGKTCVMSAMSMSHREQPNGMTCSLFKDIAGLPDKDRRQIGLERMAAAIKAIEQGSVPQPTAAEMMILTYSLTEPGRGEYQIELFDYPGELLRLQGNELAEQLFEQMQTMDGILILAEMPHEREDNEAIYRQLEHLEDAVTKLRHRLQSQTIRAPVALLINKWDRQSGSLNYADPSDEERKLETYLNQREPTPPHRKLIQTLRNAMGEHNVRILPMSAFGHARIDEQTGKEVPLNRRPLQSFYLLEGFRWLVHRHDDLRLEHIAQRFDNDPWWRFGFEKTEQEPFYVRWLHLKTLKDIDTASQGFSADAAPEKAARLAELRQRALGRKWARAASVLVIVFAIFPSLGLVAKDSLDRLTLKSKADQADASQEMKEQYQNWLTDYIKSPVPSPYLLVFSKTDAMEELRTLIASEEEKYCAPLIEETGEVACTAARDCLRQYPLGEYSARARTRIYECDAREQEHKDLASWAAVEAAEAGSEAQRKAASDYLRAFPTGNQTVEANRIIARYDSQLEWNDFASAYHRALTDGRIAEAATMLMGRSPPTEPLQGLKQAYADRATGWLDAELRQIAEGKDWDRLERLEHQVQQLRQLPPDLLSSRQAQEIRDKVTKAKDARDQLEANQMSAKLDRLLEEGKFRSAFEEVRSPSANPRMRDLQQAFQERVPPALERQLDRLRANGNWEPGSSLLAEATSLPLDNPVARSRIAELERQFKESHDRELYAQCHQNPSIDRCQNYLAKAPLKTMERAAQHYIDFASKQNTAQDYTLILESISSPKNYGKVKVLVRVDNRIFIDEELAVKEGRTNTGKRLPFTKKPSDRIDIAVDLTNIGMIFDGSLGTKTDNMALDSLRHHSLCVPHPKEKASPVCLNFTLSGLADAPAMPPWGG